jgi:hypothetical protein
VFAFLAAAYATYLKEPVFGAIAIIAIASLLSGKSSLKERIFNWALLLNSLIFIIIYVYRLLFKEHEKIYATITASILDGISNQLQNEPLLYLVICLTIIRTYSIFLKKDKKHMATDSLLFAGGGYAFAYTLLNLTSNYYLVPAITLFIPSFAVFLSNSKRHMRHISICLVAICAWNSISYSKSLVLDVWEHRKNDHLFFEYLVEKHKSGKSLFWLSNLFKEDLGYMYQRFIDYYSGFACKMERVFDFDKFNKNSLILYETRTAQGNQFKKIYDKLTKLGFRKVKEFNGSASGAIVFAHD